MAGKKLIAADPEVQMSTTGISVVCAIPRAINPADRSSGITLQFILPCLAKARVNGALLEPGAIMASFIPSWKQISGIA